MLRLAEEIDWSCADEVYSGALVSSALAISRAAQALSSTLQLQYVRKQCSVTVTLTLFLFLYCI